MSFEDEWATERSVGGGLLMDKRYLVLPAVLVAAAAVVAAVQLWPSTLKDLRAENLCLGMLTRETAGVLDDRKGGELVVDDDSGPVFSAVCFVSRRIEGADRLQYTLDARPADTLDAPMKGATQLTAGRSGWVGPRQSEVQLPAGCGKEMKTDARYVTVTLKVAPGVVVAENWNDAALIAASRTVVLEAVDNLAKQYDCKG
ncbi:hypothetical protein [Streptomyces sp. NPDC097981]|uniref:hypothetical protein n=1 Tax=Streptomyces sp. NPDC097981 TaxID=3155428 RepID=UPI00332B44E4